MRRVKRRHYHFEVDDDDLLLLADGSSDDCESPFSEFALQDVAAELWAEHGEAILADWVRHSPGCRPWPWWAFESPEPRKQIGGTGVADWIEFPAVVPALAWGIPCRWHGGDPVFESQAAYLARLGLLLPGEGPAIREPHPVPGGSMHWQAYHAST